MTVRRKIGLGIAALAFLLVVVFVVRGTWSTSTEKNPEAAAEGAVVRLFKDAQGRKLIRSAIVIDRSIDEVWKRVTDYPSFPKMFPEIGTIQVDREPDGRTRLRYPVKTFLGTWPVDVRVRHEESPDRRVASWDEPFQDLRVNRGSWTLTPTGPGRTLVVHRLEIEVKGLPEFFTRNLLLTAMKSVLAGVRAR